MLVIEPPFDALLKPVEQLVDEGRLVGAGVRCDAKRGALLLAGAGPRRVERALEKPRLEDYLRLREASPAGRTGQLGRFIEPPQQLRLHRLRLLAGAGRGALKMEGDAVPGDEVRLGFATEGQQRQCEREGPRVQSPLIPQLGSRPDSRQKLRESSTHR